MSRFILCIFSSICTFKRIARFFFTRFFHTNRTMGNIHVQYLTISFQTTNIWFRSVPVMHQVKWFTEYLTRVKLWLMVLHILFWFGNFHRRVNSVNNTGVQQNEKNSYKHENHSMPNENIAEKLELHKNLNINKNSNEKHTIYSRYAFICTAKATKTLTTTRKISFRPWSVLKCWRRRRRRWWC